MNWPDGMGPQLVTLLDGRLVWSDAVEWARECEAREVAKMDPEARARFYEAARPHRSPEAIERLRDDVQRVRTLGPPEWYAQLQDGEA